MNTRSIARRYAKVLFEMDRSQGNYEQRLVDIDTTLKVLKDNPRLLQFLHAPQIDLGERKALFKNCVQGRFDGRWMNFMDYLINKGRLTHLEAIAEEYRLMANREQGIREAEIITAVPMNAECEAKLQQKLEKDYQKRIKLNKKVDPRIIGGAVLIFENEMLDWSVAGRLKKLKENLILESA